MHELWAAYGFYLWALTTALVIIALTWLGWNTFASQPEAADSGESDETGTSRVDELETRLTTLAEAAPHMQATLGRTLQFIGMVRYADTAGAQAFTLAVSNARGDGFVLSSSVRGGLSAKPLIGWTSGQPLSQEEQSAIDRARGQQENL